MFSHLQQNPTRIPNYGTCHPWNATWDFDLRQIRRKTTRKSQPLKREIFLKKTAGMYSTVVLLSYYAKSIR